MEDACYLCRRTQADLDRLNEETRTRVYLSYFTNARSQIDDLRRKISFLQRLKDEESGDPHFRINAKQVFSDPGAYKKMMPWIETLVELGGSVQLPSDDSRTMADLVVTLLAALRRSASELEEATDHLRGTFASGEKSPLTLTAVSMLMPVGWKVDHPLIHWQSRPGSESAPIASDQSGAGPTVSITIHLCSLCQRLLARS